MLSSKIIALLSCFAAFGSANFTIWSDVLDQIDSTQIRDQVVNAHRFVKELDPNSDLRISGLLLYKHASNVTAHHPGLDTGLESVLSEATAKPQVSSIVPRVSCGSVFCFFKKANRFNSDGERDNVEKSACKFIEDINPNIFTYVGVLVLGLKCRDLSPDPVKHCESLVKVVSQTKDKLTSGILKSCSSAVKQISRSCKRVPGNVHCGQSIYTVKISPNRVPCENGGRDRICKVESCKSANAC